MAFVAESLGFNSGDTWDCGVTACDQPVSGSKSSWSQEMRGVARDAQGGSGGPSPLLHEGHIVNHWTSELTGSAVNTRIDSRVTNPY